VNEEPKTLIITVNFQHADSAVCFLESASRLEEFGRCHVLVVDNDSADDSIYRIRRAIYGFGNVELMESWHNRGYFGAASWALRQYLARHNVPDWVIVCNHDIVFDDPKFLVRLLKKEPEAAGVIAPSIISGLTRHDANPSIRHRPSSFRMWRYRVWLGNYYAMWLKQWLSPAIRKARQKLFKGTASGRKGVTSLIYAPHGAFLIFSRKFFEAGGFIDDGFFLYAEEFSVAEMCRQLRLPVMHDPELRVWHREGQSTGRMLSRRVYHHQKNGFAYALRRYKNSYPEIDEGAPAVRVTVPDVTSEAAGERIR
jgi:GT2 family glycosyltransferase